MRSLGERKQSCSKLDIRLRSTARVNQDCVKAVGLAYFALVVDTFYQSLFRVVLVGTMVYIYMYSEQARDRWVRTS